MSGDAEVVVVGGGIAGCALAVTLARSGIAVTVLEASTTYRDRVRGEALMPWGVAEAKRLGLYDVLCEAGANHGTRWTTLTCEGSQELPVALMVPGVPGLLNLGHPAACQALHDAAIAVGSTVIRGVRDIQVSAGGRPTVRYQIGDASHEQICRLVVGADGRGSRVRRQAGIRLRTGVTSHKIAGLLVEGLDGVCDDTQILGVDAGRVVLYFPQGDQRGRLYLVWPEGALESFAGVKGQVPFLKACALDAIPGSEHWSDAVPLGPCATYPSCDTWVDAPVADGVALIGDAGGYNDPIIGQGLSLALRDVRALAEALTESPDWTQDLSGYATERTQRLRAARLSATLAAALDGFGPLAPANLALARRQVVEDPVLGPVFKAIFTGPDSVSEDALRADLGKRIAALA